MQRRTLVTASASLVMFAATRPAGLLAAVKQGSKPMDTVYAPSRKGTVTGTGRGDFDFLTGEWSIRHRKRTSPDRDEWTEFASSATVHRVLDGAGSIEELRNPNGSYMGMGVRTWLPKQEQWADHWTSAGDGVVNPPQLGRFIDGEGIFITEETVDGTAWSYRGVWDRIAPGSCRWHQSSSSDGGKSWTWDWWMEWTRR